MCLIKGCFIGIISLKEMQVEEIIVGKAHHVLKIGGGHGRVQGSIQV